MNLIFPRRVLTALLTVATLVTAGCGRPPEPLVAATALPSPRPLPAFTLTASEGASYTEQQLHGHPTLLFFGFTSCPDVCPTTLTTLAAARRQLADLPDARRPGILFVSVDPLRDTPPQLASYAEHFGAGVHAVTGDTANLDRLTHALGAHYRLPPEPTPDTGYMVEHSAQVYVLDADGRFIAVFSPPLEAQTMAADLRRLLSR